MCCLDARVQVRGFCGRAGPRPRARVHHARQGGVHGGGGARVCAAAARVRAAGGGGGGGGHYDGGRRGGRGAAGGDAAGTRGRGKVVVAGGLQCLGGCGAWVWGCVRGCPILSYAISMGHGVCVLADEELEGQGMLVGSCAGMGAAWGMCRHAQGADGADGVHHQGAGTLLASDSLNLLQEGPLGGFHAHLLG